MTFFEAQPDELSEKSGKVFVRLIWYSMLSYRGIAEHVKKHSCFG